MKIDNDGRIGIIILIVIVTFIVVSSFFNYINNEEVSCKKVCKAQGLEFYGVEKENTICLCNDDLGKFYVSKYFRMDDE